MNNAHRDTAKKFNIPENTYVFFVGNFDIFGHLDLHIINYSFTALNAQWVDIIFNTRLIVETLFTQFFRCKIKEESDRK